MRCPSCGATNPDGAAWCGQCYRRFDDEASTATPGTRDATPAPAAANGQTDSGGAVLQSEQSESPLLSTTAEGAAGAAQAEGFRRQGDDIEWQCPQCATYNDIALQVCAVCGTSFLERFRTDEPEPVRNWPAALALSVVAPGAGHVSVGRYGTGWARLVLFYAWVIGAMVLASAGGRNALIIATPLVLGAVILWAVTLVDVYRLQQGDPEILGGRQLLWLVVGVLLLLGISLFAGFGGASTPPAGAG